MLATGLICLSLLTLTTLIHYEVLRLLSAKLPDLRMPPRRKLIAVMLSAFLAHGLEILLYGLSFYLSIHYGELGRLSGTDKSSFMNCIYLSTETYSSLGFGDVVPLGPIRMLAGVEALNGLLLIGWTASYTYLAMEKYWKLGAD